jgi:hypothetical protein
VNVLALGVKQPPGPPASTKYGGNFPQLSGEDLTTGYLQSESVNTTPPLPSGRHRVAPSAARRGRHTTPLTSSLTVGKTEEYGATVSRDPLLLSILPPSLVTSRSAPPSLPL